MYKTIGIHGAVTEPQQEASGMNEAVSFKYVLLLLKSSL